MEELFPPNNECSTGWQNSLAVGSPGQKGVRAQVAVRALISHYQSQSDCSLLLQPQLNLFFQREPQQYSQFLVNDPIHQDSRGNQTPASVACRPQPEPRLVFSLKR